MNNLIDSHNYRITNSVIVFGIAGLLFYVGLALGGFLLRYSLQLFGLQRGFGI